MLPESVESFKALLEKSLNPEYWAKIILSDVHVRGEDWKKAQIKPVQIKDQLHWSFVFKHPYQDITKNYLPEQAIEKILSHIEQMEVKVLTLFTVEGIFILQYQNKKWRLRQDKNQALLQVGEWSHDHQKQRWVDAKAQYLHLLGLSNAAGKIFDKSQDKFKQINEYIKLLAPALQSLSAESLSVVDMGSGKGYLTFALYDYYTKISERPMQVIGVELRDKLVQQCNEIARSCGFDGLHFVKGMIADFKPEGNPDVLIALHACDTATDDAIAAGVRYQSKLIVVAPCCHKQIRREIEQSKTKNSRQFLTRFGIFLEREAEMLTDGIRALILEYFGYKVKVMQFVSDAHTPKNVMILAEKNKIDPKRQQEVLTEINQIKKEWGIGRHHLEDLLLK